MNEGPAATRSVALVWEQLAPYHIDRIEAVAARLGPGVRVLGVEIAASSHTYAWAQSGTLGAGEKLRLFEARRAEDIPVREKVAALTRALAGCDLVILGLPSSSPWVAALALRLRAAGAKVWFGSDSKADDYARPAWREAIKRLVLRAYDGAIVAGRRSAAYYRGLGLPDHAILPGYDTLSMVRVGQLARDEPEPAFAGRPFLSLGRFVPKKNLFALLRAYADYRALAGNEARRLVMAGSGPQEVALRDFAQELGVAQHVDWPGFLDASASARLMARSLALLLLSNEEQWGLVVNEAVAAGLPVIATKQVGATDLLVKDGVNGFLVPDGDVTAAATAMHQIGLSEIAWSRLSEACAGFRWPADSARFADAVESLLDPSATGARAEVERLRAMIR